MSIESLIERYSSDMKEIRQEKNPGQIRAKKGALVEFLATELVRMSWRRLGNSLSRLTINGDRKKIPIRRDGDVYSISQDRHVYVDGKFVLSIEAKSYAETAMYKRILFDAYLLSTEYPDLSFVLIQLESMLGGDYSSKIESQGSGPVRVLNSVFPDLHIEIITLLDGERNIRRPIHKKEFFKPLNKERVKKAIETFMGILEKYSEDKSKPQLDKFTQ